jgi:hypothetical protein
VRTIARLEELQTKSTTERLNSVRVMHLSVIELVEQLEQGTGFA